MTEADKESTQRKTPLGIERRFDRFGDWLDTSWAAKVVTPVLERHPHSIQVVTWLMRIVVGCTFVVSGLVKAIDPWGTYYKMQEYLTALHIPLEEWGNMVLALSFFLFSMEFIVGVSLLTGCFRKATPIFSALFMLVMLPLTLWIAVVDPVSDCGCFGDFLVISNWATFIKNVLLSIAVVWLLKFNSRAVCLVAPYLQWIAAVVMSVYILIIGFIGYREQPLIDFRQYKIGTRLLAGEEGPEYIPTFDFVYEKDGKEKRFGEDDELPDESEGWEFVRREEKEFVANEKSSDEALSVSEFRIWNEDATEDVTESIDVGESQLVLLIPDISNLSMATSWKINRLYDIANDHGVEFFAVASGNPEEIDEWRDLSSGQYTIYTAQDISIKELVRGNPGLVSLEGGIIKWKTALSSIILSDSDDLDESEDNGENVLFRTYPIGTAMNGSEAFLSISLILISFLSILILISHFPKIEWMPQG